jgi:hypothetical protein
VALVLGAICAVSAAGDLHTRPQPLQGVIFRKVTTVLGAIALLAGLAGLIADSGKALEILVVATGFLRFGTLPLRAEAIVLERHFSLAAEDGPARIELRGTWEPDGQPHAAELARNATRWPT